MSLDLREPDRIVVHPKPGQSVTVEVPHGPAPEAVAQALRHELKKRAGGYKFTTEHYVSVFEMAQPGAAGLVRKQMGHQLGAFIAPNLEISESAVWPSVAMRDYIAYRAGVYVLTPRQLDKLIEDAVHAAVGG